MFMSTCAFPHAHAFSGGAVITLVLPTPANASGKSRALTSQSWNLGDYGTQYLLILTKSSLKTWLLKKNLKKEKLGFLPRALAV